MNLRRTPLYQRHIALGGRMTPFAGWEMPVQYSSIIEEHLRVRNFAGIFDVSHMGEIVVRGENALDLLEKTTCNLVSSLSDGQVQYNAVLNEEGGVVDDVTIYRVNATEYFVVANASNHESVSAHLQRYAVGKVDVENQSDAWHLIALQGPRSEEIMAKVLKLDLSDLGYFRFRDILFNGERLRISRTGYTGEDGFELYSSNETGVQLWDRLLQSGGPEGLLPVGLGARDTLRLEALYALYGHELSSDRSPVESGIAWIVRRKSPPYLGMERILDQKEKGPTQKVVPFRLLEGGVPREGYPILDSTGKEIGKTLSGAFSPSLKLGIGTALLPAGLAAAGERIQVDSRGRHLQAEVVAGPFVQGSVKRPARSGQ